MKQVVDNSVSNLSMSFATDSIQRAGSFESGKNGRPMHLQSMTNQRSQPRRGAWAHKSGRYHNSMQFDMQSHKGADKQNIIIQDSLYADKPYDQLTISCGEGLILSDENKNMLSEKFFKMGDSDESIK